jgi:uncharacterized protein (UPF0264 family)
MPLAAVADWIAAARSERLLSAVAGKITLESLAILRDLGADVAGIRGAARIGGREGRASAERVGIQPVRRIQPRSAARIA